MYVHMYVHRSIGGYYVRTYVANFFKYLLPYVHTVACSDIDYYYHQDAYYVCTYFHFSSLGVLVCLTSEQEGFEL